MAAMGGQGFLHRRLMEVDVVEEVSSSTGPGADDNHGMFELEVVSWSFERTSAIWFVQKNTSREKMVIYLIDLYVVNDNGVIFICDS